MYHIYQRNDLTSKLKYIENIQNIEDLFWTSYNEKNFIEHFSDNDTDVFMKENVYSEFFNSYIPVRVYKYVVYCNNTLLSPATILGLYHPWNRKQQQERRKRWYNKPRRRSAWGGYRKIRTFQERKWSYAIEDQDVKIRRRRNATNLPNNWDDIRAWNLKSWKKQSKRKHQWKTK